MTRILFLLTLFCFGGSVRSQSVALTGIVLDADSGKPLPYAHILLKGKSIGTVSQTNGSFTFHFPEASENDTLEISHIGFQTFQKVIGDIVISEPLLVRLTPRVTELETITIRGSSIRAVDVIASVIRTIPLNYANDPHLLQGFFRDWKMIDFHGSQKNQSLLVEAAVNINVRNTKKRSGTDVYLKALRRNELPEKGWHYFNSLQDLLNRNYITNPVVADFYDLEALLKLPNSYSFKFNSNLSDDRFLCIEATSADNNMMYTLFVDEQTHAIARIDLRNRSPFQRGEWNILKVDNTYHYRELDGRWYLSYCRRNWRIEKVERATNSLNRTEEYYLELLVNNIIRAPDKQQLSSLGTAMVSNRPLEFQTTDIDTDFWNNYNVVENDSLIIKINEFENK